MIRSILAALLLAACASAEELRGRVVDVHDGDTITVLDAAKAQHKVRLAGIDAPESKQAFGEASRKSLAGLVAGKEVVVDVEGRDRYGREIGRVRVGEVDANLEQVKAGMAWHYLRYAPKAADLAAAEKAARTARAGLWADSAPTPPWDWRKKTP